VKNFNKAAIFLCKLTQPAQHVSVCRSTVAQSGEKHNYNQRKCQFL